MTSSFSTRWVTADDNVKSITDMRLLEISDLELSHLTLKLFGASS
ncbi:MAG: hypothetical protein QNK37_15970 [Acidobacteriota bacterium]|nr:hypothetical protein [Acidobacteriota bacterium]